MAEIERRHEKVEDAIFDGPVCRTCRHIDGAAVSYPCDAAIVLAEIRRLREERNYALGKETDAKNELANRDYVEWRRAYDSDLGKRIEILSQNLSAHQAVVRELAETLEESDEPGQAQEEECARWRARKEAALAHPLVVAARKGDE